MRAGQGRAWWLAVGPLLVLLAGCATSRMRIEKALREKRASAPQVAHYVVRCPDVLLLHVPGRPGWSGRRVVDVDGRIALDGRTRLQADGLTPRQIADAVAVAAEGRLGGPAAVEVAEFNSQQLFLFGEVSGLQRAVAYKGPERVVDLLRRTGGISPGAAHHDIRIVRAHIAEGEAAEVFPVDLTAILLEDDPHTNVTLQPFDRVYIAQSKRSVVACCVPPWVRKLSTLTLSLLKQDQTGPERRQDRKEKRGRERAGLPPPPPEGR